MYSTSLVTALWSQTLTFSFTVTHSLTVYLNASSLYAISLTVTFSFFVVGTFSQYL